MILLLILLLPLGIGVGGGDFLKGSQLCSSLFFSKLFELGFGPFQDDFSSVQEKENPVSKSSTVRDMFAIMSTTGLDHKLADLTNCKGATHTMITRMMRPKNNNTIVTPTGKPSFESEYDPPCGVVVLLGCWSAILSPINQSLYSARFLPYVS